MRRGDVLASYDGRPIRNTWSFTHIRRGERTEDKPRALVIHRDGKKHTVPASPGLLGVNWQDSVAPTRLASRLEAAKTP